MKTEATAVGVRPRYRVAMLRLATAQKSSRGAGLYSRFVNRPLGRRLASLCYILGMTPTGVTVLSGVWTFVGIGLLGVAPPGWLPAIAATVALALGYALDSADGQLARLQDTASLSGEWLDHMVDCVKLSAIHVAILISMVRFFDVNQRWALIPLGFMVVENAIFFGKILNDQLRRLTSMRTGAAIVSSESIGLGKVLIAAPTDYGVRLLSMLLWAVPTVFLGVYTVMFAVNATFLANRVVRWYGEMRRLDLAG